LKKKHKEKEKDREKRSYCTKILNSKVKEVIQTDNESDEGNSSSNEEMEIFVKRYNKCIQCKDAQHSTNNFSYK